LRRVIHDEQAARLEVDVNGRPWLGLRADRHAPRPEWRVVCTTRSRDVSARTASNTVAETIKSRVRMTAGCDRRSRVFEERHEPEVHVQLLVTVKKRQSWIVCDEIELDLLKAAQHHHVFHHACGGPSADVGQLEAVPM
jgi:hypothetical protein